MVPQYKPEYVSREEFAAQVFLFQVLFAVQSGLMVIGFILLWNLLMEVKELRKTFASLSMDVQHLNRKMDALSETVQRLCAAIREIYVPEVRRAKYISSLSSITSRSI